MTLGITSQTVELLSAILPNCAYIKQANTTQISFDLLFKIVHLLGAGGGKENND